MKIFEGEKMPLLYGAAWINYIDRSYTAYPIPFNFLTRWLREVWFILRVPPKTRMDDAYESGYQAGLKSGESYGFIKGKREGEKEGYERYAKEIGLSLINR